MGSSTSLREKDIAVFNKLRAEWGLDEAATAPAAQKGDPEQVTTIIVMMNHGVGNAVSKPNANYDWSGHVIDNFPLVIPPSRSAKTTHRGVPPDDSRGSKGAIVFYGPDKRGGPEDCAWVFAWSVPGDGSPNKVYAFSAPSSVYPPDSINWDAILAKLDLPDTTNDSHSPVDPITGAETVAHIDKYGNTPALFVSFNITKQ